MFAKFPSAPLCLVSGAACFALAAVACSSSSTNPGFDGGGAGFGGSSSSSGGGFGGSSSSGGGFGSSSSGGGGFGGSSSSSSGGGGFGSNSSSSGGGGFGGSSSSSGGGVGGSSSSSGVGVGSSSSGAVTGSSQCIPTTAVSPAITLAPNALQLTPANFQHTLGLGGYMYNFSDAVQAVPGPSIACNNGAAMCAAGSIGVANPPTYSNYGGGLGIYVNGVGVDTTMVAASGSGLMYTLTNLPTGSGGVRLILYNAGVSYCAPLTSASATIPWGSFTPMCYAAAGLQGVALAGAPTAINKIQFQMTSGATTSTYNFCITALAYAP